MANIPSPSDTDTTLATMRSTETSQNWATVVANSAQAVIRAKIVAPRSAVKPSSFVGEETSSVDQQQVVIFALSKAIVEVSEKCARLEVECVTASEKHQECLDAALAERDEKLAHAAKEIYSLKAINTELEAKLAQYVSLSAPRSVFEGISTKNNARSWKSLAPTYPDCPTKGGELIGTYATEREAVDKWLDHVESLISNPPAGVDDKKIKLFQKKVAACKSRRKAFGWEVAPQPKFDARAAAESDA